MKIDGQMAVDFLSKIGNRVVLYKKDNSDKFWSYKIKSPYKTEFAFDPNTTTGLYVRVDRQPPDLPGLSDIKPLAGKDVSTALGRVFSGGIHKANYLVTIENLVGLEEFITHYESL